MTDVSESYLESLRESVSTYAQTLAAEQREHAVTTQQSNAALDELAEERRLNNASLKPSMGVDNQAVVDMVVEKDDKISILMQRIAHADERLETANAMATTYADANAALKRELAITTQRLDNSLTVTDEMACRNEEVMSIKKKLSRANEVAISLADANGDLKMKICALKDSAETQERHMPQVDAARKAAEAKVQEQQKEIEALKRGEDLWICPSVDICNPMHKCGNREPHVHKDAAGSCNYRCRLATGICVKINTCKECATLREEIINRDAVILQQESRAEDREEIIKSLAKEIKMSSCVEITAPTTGTYTIMFSG